MPRQHILGLLRGGDRRSIGQSGRVASIVSKNPKLFSELMAGLWSGDLLVRMRAADAAEKVTRAHPEYLKPHKLGLLRLLSTAEQQELRWHLAAMVPRLSLTAKERSVAVTALNGYLDDRSSIVKTYALHGLADLAQTAPDLRPAVVETLREATRSGTPAMKARARKLLLRLTPI